MYFLVDDKKKIIFGWSAKCGCSHVKTIFMFLTTNKEKNKIHTKEEMKIIPNDIENYITIIFSRNPYHRLVSGFLDKYGPKRQFRHLWKKEFLSFSNFVNELLKNNWKSVEFHHFTPQTTEAFNDKIKFSKILKIFDICKIDYKYIEGLYDKKIPKSIMDRKLGHERTNIIKKNIFNDYVYDLHIDNYYYYDINYLYFYNEEIKENVNKFFINDFNFFKKYGLIYNI